MIATLPLRVERGVKTTKMKRINAHREI